MSFVTVKDVKKFRAENECSLDTAFRCVKREMLVKMVEKVDSMEDVKEVLRILIREAL